MSTIITKRQFPHYHKYTMDLAGRPLTLEVGKLAELANAAVMVGYGDTRVLCCVTAAPRPRDGIDFFPLSVDFEEKMYAVGRIPGSFNRREGRPGEKGILTSRVIDRPIRPLFPYDFRNDVSVMCTVMAVDHDCSPEIAALIGTSAALAISDIPWNGPVAALKVGLVDGKLVFNPDAEQRKVSDLDVTVVSTGKKVVMIEAGANEVPNDVMFEAIKQAHEENQKQIALINQMVAEIGKPKFEYPHADFNYELFNKITADFMDEAKAAMDKTGYPYRTGTVATGDWFGIPGRRADWVRDTFHPLLCEMQGGAVAQVCCRCGVPFMALKSVSDCLTSKHDYNFNFPTAMQDLNAAVMAFVDHLED